ncbi:MAG: peptidylprolyl isomerase [Cytophagales bacterium]|nr:MAG: peptidylprolyl isomerase [Cytophagales bacterium]
MASFLQSYQSFTISIFILYTLLACNPTQKITNTNSEPVIATIGQTPLYVSDFKYLYEKNATNPDYSKQSIEEYLQNYINYKLKIVDAQEEKIDQRDGFKREMQSYRDQLAQPYLIDQEKVDELVKEAYNRMQEEVNVSHILLKVSEEADPQDTLIAYEKIIELRKKALEGKSFENLAYTYSEDPTAQFNNGNIGYFTALQMMYNFENASYNATVGEISGLFRTSLGYHFLKVLDRRPANGTIKTAHIMVSIAPNASAADSAKAKKRIEEVYEKLQKGGDWSQLCIEYSDDKDSRNKAGELPEFTIRKVIPEFEKVALNLQNKGEISKPFITQYGWHIIKLLEKQKPTSFEEVEDELRQKVLRGSRYEITQKALVDKLQKNNALQENIKTYEKIRARADNALLRGEWNYEKNDPSLNEALISFENKDLKQKREFTVGDFFQYITEKQVPKSDINQPANYFDILYKRFKDFATIEFEKSLLEKKYPNYQLLVKDYTEGMMLFQIMNEKVWQKALNDTLGAEKYFLQNREQYQWKTRANATIYELTDTETAQKLNTLLEQERYAIINPTTFLFEKDSYKIDNKTAFELEKWADRLRTQPNLQIEIAGHADPAESGTLSLSRAKEVSTFLQQKGVKQEQIIVKDFSFFKPISKTERNKNRRIELTLFSTDKQTAVNILNAEKPNSIKKSNQIFEKGDNNFLDTIEWKIGTQTINDTNGKIIRIDIAEIFPPRPKEFKEAKGKVINDYQLYLENEWINALKKKHIITYNQPEIQKLIIK